MFFVSEYLWKLSVNNFLLVKVTFTIDRVCETNFLIFGLKYCLAICEPYYVLFKFFKMFSFIFESRDRERDRAEEEPGTGEGTGFKAVSMLTAESPMWGSNSQNCKIMN